MMFDNLIGGSIDPRVDAKNAIIDELRAAGASDNLIRGVMANVQDESGFNAGLRHPDQPRWSGEPHYAHGLYQEGAQEWINYDNWLKQNYPGQSWTDPALQTRFLGQNLKQNYPSVWSTMNNVRTPEEAAQAFVSGYLKPREDLRLQRVAAYGRGVPELDSYVPGASVPTNMSQDDLLARSIGAGNADSASEPSAEDRLSSAMLGASAVSGKGTSMPPVLQIHQQTAQAPIDLTDEGPSYKQLADALLASGQAMGRTAHTPWEALGSIAQIASGTWQGEKAKAAEKDYLTKLAAALSGAQTTDAMTSALIHSGNPELIKAGLQAKLSPKEFKLGPGEVQYNAAGQVVANNNQPKPPEGYIAGPGGSLRPIPGGPSDPSTVKEMTAAKGHEYNSSEMKAIEDAQHAVETSKNLQDSIRRAQDYSSKVAGGWGSKTGAWIRNNTIPSENSAALENLDNEVMNSMLPALKTIFPGRVTNIDVELMKGLQGVSGQPKNIRETTLNRALERAQQIQAQKESELEALRNKTFFKPGGGSGSTSTATPATTSVNNPFLFTPSPSSSTPAQPSSATPPQSAADALKANPALRDQFDAKYGSGASAAILGQ